MRREACLRSRREFISVGGLEMLWRAALVFLLFGLEQAVGAGRCGPLGRPRDGAVVCRRGLRRASCRAELPVDSVAEFSCREFYRLSPDVGGVLRCRENGSWSSAAPKCIPGLPAFPTVWVGGVAGLFRMHFPNRKYVEVKWVAAKRTLRRLSDCGRRRGSVSLVVNGGSAPRGAFPWHVAIYCLVDGSYEYWCGGSLISEVAVVTAAHCVWEVTPENLVLAFGKFHREYASDDRDVQRRRARRIETLSSYQDVSGNYNGDVAVIFVEGRVRVGGESAPVCVDWEQRLMEEQLSEGALGEVAGWGLTENDTLGDSLRAVRLPVVSDAKCIAEQQQDFQKFVTFTAFCAGFANGTGVCNGDSGGGLAFFDGASGRWYLQGLVSVSPRRKGTPYCDPFYYTVFTKVGVFSRWLEAVVKSDGASWDERKPDEGSLAKTKLDAFYAALGEELLQVNGSLLIYPHTKAMLELAGLRNSSLEPPGGGRLLPPN